MLHVRSLRMCREAQKAGDTKKIEKKNKPSTDLCENQLCEIFLCYKRGAFCIKLDHYVPPVVDDVT